MVIKIIMIIALILLILMILNIALHQKLNFKKSIMVKCYCKMMGWHRPDNTMTFNGMNFCSRCKDCKEFIMLDGQGNWF